MDGDAWQLLNAMVSGSAQSGRPLTMALGRPVMRASVRMTRLVGGVLLTQRGC